MERPPARNKRNLPLLTNDERERARFAGITSHALRARISYGLTPDQAVALGVIPKHIMLLSEVVAAGKKAKVHVIRIIYRIRVMGMELWEAIDWGQQDELPPPVREGRVFTERGNSFRIRCLKERSPARCQGSIRIFREPTVYDPNEMTWERIAAEVLVRGADDHYNQIERDKMQ